MNEKLVSIIMPVFNAERFLHQAIQSILDQTYKNFELVIINDGSTDSSSKIIKSFSDERIRSFFFENQGVSKSRNIGISEAHGEFIALMDADDISEPTRIEKQLKYLLTNREIDIVGTNCIHIDENGKAIGRKEYYLEHEEIEHTAPLFNAMSFPTMMVSSKILKNIQRYNEELFVSEDHDLILRLIQKKIKINNIQEYLYRYRIHKRSLSNTLLNIQKANHYRSSLSYLEYLAKNNEYQIDNYRRGLLEYYYGNVSTSRNYLIRSLRQNFPKKFKVLRIIILSLLGSRVINDLRDKGFLKFMNKIILRIFKINLQKV